SDQTTSRLRRMLTTTGLWRKSTEDFERIGPEQILIMKYLLMYLILYTMVIMVSLFFRIIIRTLRNKLCEITSELVGRLNIGFSNPKKIRCLFGFISPRNSF